LLQTFPNGWGLWEYPVDKPTITVYLWRCNKQGTRGSFCRKTDDNMGVNAHLYFIRRIAYRVSGIFTGQSGKPAGRWFKKGLALLPVLFIAGTIMAQDEILPMTSLGIKFGANSSRMYFNPAIGQNLTLNYQGGLVFKYVPERNTGIQVELNYLQQEWSEKLDSTNRYSRQMEFVSIPFMTHIRVGKGSTNLIINFGPNASYLLSEKEIILMPDSVDGQSYYGEKIKSKLSFGLSLGVGITQKTPIGTFQIEARFSNNINDFFSSISSSSTNMSKLQSAEITLSYLVCLKKKTFKTIK
jgi:hypothetical protein